ncbi:MAG: hypothetical protein MK066_12730 [Crocinitomicaceae bacterium]|nr:hypothetical protein [Crocinitomicaceae bacterium]
MRLFLLFVGLFISVNSLACDCIPQPEMSLEFHRTRTVFVGRVTNIKPDSDSKGALLVVTFEVSDNLKSSKKSTIKIKTSASGKSCGYEFRLGQRYLVYANMARPGLMTSVCSRTTPLSKAKNDLLFICKTTKTKMNPEWEKHFRD